VSFCNSHLEHEGRIGGKSAHVVERGAEAVARAGVAQPRDDVGGLVRRGLDQLQHLAHAQLVPVALRHEKRPRARLLERPLGRIVLLKPLAQRLDDRRQRHPLVKLKQLRILARVRA
jgi:hypothetical protein